MSLREAFEHYCSRAGPLDANRRMFAALVAEIEQMKKPGETPVVRKRGRPKGSKNRKAANV
jgi:hypothetical protein